MGENEPYAKQVVMAEATLMISFADSMVYIQRAQADRLESFCILGSVGQGFVSASVKVDGVQVDERPTLLDLLKDLPGVVQSGIQAYEHGNFQQPIDNQQREISGPDELIVVAQTLGCSRIGESVRYSELSLEIYGPSEPRFGSSYALTFERGRTTSIDDLYGEIERAVSSFEAGNAGDVKQGLLSHLERELKRGNGS